MSSVSWLLRGVGGQTGWLQQPGCVLSLTGELTSYVLLHWPMLGCKWRTLLRTGTPPLLNPVSQLDFTSFMRVTAKSPRVWL